MCVYIYIYIYIYMCVCVCVCVCVCEFVIACVSLFDVSYTTQCPSCLLKICFQDFPN